MAVTLKEETEAAVLKIITLHLVNLTNRQEPILLHELILLQEAMRRREHIHRLPREVILAEVMILVIGLDLQEGDN